MKAKVFLWASLLVAPVVTAQLKDPDVEARLIYLENILANQADIKIIQQLATLEQEIQELRGLAEVQAHELQVLRKQLEGKTAPDKVQAFIDAHTPLASSQTKNPYPALEAQNQSDLATQHYQAAYRLLEQKNYPAAIISFQNFLEQYPLAVQKAAALYWLGDIYLLQWQKNKTNSLLRKNAETYFTKVLQEHPQHLKVSESSLKLGIIAAELGNWSEAERYLRDIITSFPDSATARVAQVRLQQIAKQGLISGKR